MFRRILMLLGGLLLVTVAVLYFLGRGRVGESQRVAVHPPSAGGEARLQSVRLYFGDPAGLALRAEDRVITEGTNLTENLRACIRELARGSLSGGAPALAEGTRLVRAFVDPWGLAYLEFDRSILGTRSLGDGEEWLAVAAIVRTVCDNFPEVREVRFMVDGQVVTSLGGSVDLEEPLRAEDFPLAPR